MDSERPPIANLSPAWPPPDEQVREALLAAYADGSWGRYHGPHCERLAAALAARHGTPHVTLCCTGTLAVELALRGMRVGPGDEVIMAAYDFPGNFRAVEAVGAKPVLVDIAAVTWCLDADALDEAAGPKTRAVLVSHLHGGLAAMERIARWAQARGIAVVEDACQAAGARVDWRPAGAWGDVAVLSFGGSKLLTAGRGGAVLTSQEEVFQRMRVFAHRGNDAFALSELQAAVLLPQLEKLDARNAQRLASVKTLTAQLADLDWLRPVQGERPGSSPSYYKLAFLLDAERANKSSSRSRADFVAAARAEGVALDEGFRGFALRGERRCRTAGALTHARRAAEDTLLLHHPVLLADAQTIRLVAEAIRKVACWYVGAV
ncbi:MAG: aminotransferase class I/II-fold pyridoxal phosphate-dependent enzyme [Pirellulales bacterium]